MKEIYKLRDDFKDKSLLHFIFQPGAWGTVNYRIAAAFWSMKNFRIMYYLYAPIWRIIATLTGVEIYGRTSIGTGLHIVHFGQIFIAPATRLGSDCRIFNGVTIGSAKYDGGSTPIIGNNVKIGVGAKVLGGITIGDNCEIGANSVVTKSFPSGRVIAGIPARVIKSCEKKN